MKSTNLTPAQVADMLGVSSSTLRLWSKQFADHLSEAARPGAGKRRTYTADDLALLQRAHAALHDGRTVADVNILLGVPAGSGVALVTTAAMIGELQAARATIADLAALQTANADAIGKLTNEVQALRSEVDAMQRRGFWARLFNRPAPGGDK